MRPGFRRRKWPAPRLRTVLLLSNLAILALPVAGLWALRLYESALLRQTEAELVAQAAVLASVFREQLHIPFEASPPGTPPQPAPAALHMARRPGLDFAVDPVLPPQPQDEPAPPGDPAAVAAGQALTPVLRDAQLVTLASLRITDRNGVIVATTGSDLSRSLKGWDEVARVLAGEPIVSSLHKRDPAQVVLGGISRTSGLRVFVALPVTDGTGAAAGVVVLSRTPNSLSDTIWGKRYPLTGLILLLIAGGAALAAAISRLVTRPLGVVVAQAQVVAAGGSLTASQHSGIREVVELSDAIARMAQTLETRANYIKGFAASVSHEFKTPLTSIRAAGELLEDHASTISPQERQRLLGVVSDGVARLELLVRRLVELARADMLRAGMGGNDATRVGPVLDRVAGRYRGRGMQIQVTGDAGSVTMPEDALVALLPSMLETACVHAPGAEVQIVARNRLGRGANHCAGQRPRHPGCRSGVGRSNRFSRRLAAHGGTGLGLPIVRAIASSVGGSVTLLPSITGAEFVISLPSAG